MKKIEDRVYEMLDKIESHQDVEIIDAPERRGFALLHKKAEILFISVVELSHLPENIRSLFRSKDRFWCKREHGMETDHYDPDECKDQLCMLLPNWAINLKVAEDKNVPQT